MTAEEDRLGRLNFSYPDELSPRVKLQLKETEYDGDSYICPTWEQMGVFNFELAKQIIQSGQSFDRLVALAKGGLTWSRAMVDALQIPKLSTTRIQKYKGVNQSEKPRIAQPLTDAIDGEGILLYDEVIDSGETIEVALEYLGAMGAKDIKTAALCYKPRSTVKPDFFAFSTNTWVVFPHEIREFVDERFDKWRKAGLLIKNIKNRLITIGIPSEQVEFFCSLKVK